MPAADLAPLLELEYPYPGLRPFEANEGFLYPAQRGQAEQLLNRLSDSRYRFLAVVGSSGSGKSSLVRAGLLPALYRGYLAGSTSQWRVAVMRPGGAPLDKLAEALAEQNMPFSDVARVRKLVGASTVGLVQAVRESAFAPGEGLLVVVDQFEELFRFTRDQTDGDAEAALFVTALLEAAESTAPIYVVLTMRSDFLGDCTHFAGLPEALNRGQYLIPRLTREQRREAIESPLRLVNARMAPRLVQRLLTELGDSTDQLPVLQHALNRTFRKWKEAGGTGEIDFEHYEQASTVQGALNDHANSIMAELGEAAAPWVEKIFRCLTTVQSGRAVRRPTRFDRLCEVVGASASELKIVREVIQLYADSRHSLLVSSTGPELRPESVIDISHETLIQNWAKLKAWVDAEDTAVRWYGSVAEDALRHQAGESGTWWDPELAKARGFLEKGPWNQSWAEWSLPNCKVTFAQVRDFLDLSRDTQRAKEEGKKAQAEKELRDMRALADAQRRAKRWLLAAACLLLLALGAAGTMVWLLQKMLDAERESSRLARSKIELQEQLSGLDSQLKSKDAAIQEIKKRLEETVGQSAAQRVELISQLEAAVRGWEQKKREAREQLMDAEYGERIKELTDQLTGVRAERDSLQRQLDEAKIGEVRFLSAPPAARPAPVKGSIRNWIDGLKYVWIPPGKFMMGCAGEECGNVELRFHQVQVTKGFWIGQTEVTRAAWRKVIGPVPSSPQDGQLPMNHVSWVDADQYCREILGRLPTEAEWEYAARAGSSEARYGPLAEIAARGKLQPVAQMRPNAFGLYDVLGNAAEWVAVANTSGGVLRGGSWAGPDRNLRLSARSYQANRSTRIAEAGFRCVGEFR